MRDSYEQVRRMGAVVLAVAPSPTEDVLAAVNDLKLPFICLSDPDRVVFRQYAVGRSAWSAGQRPAVFLIAPQGQVVKAWKGRQQWEIPSVDQILAALTPVDTDASG